MQHSLKTQIGIIGGGPSGLLLSQLLHLRGIQSIILEKHSRDYVLARIRAGVLEHGFARLMREAECGKRMDVQGQIHEGFDIAYHDRRARIDLKGLTGGNSVIVYGQSELTRDLYEARDKLGGMIIHEAQDVQPHDITSTTPSLSYRTSDGAVQRIACDYIIGADGFHGVARQAIPKTKIREYERIYPFGWLGLLSQTPPVSKELIYATHERGFALCSLRSKSLSRYYIQVPITDNVTQWSDDAFWGELHRRLPQDVAQRLISGPALEKSIAPLRSYVCEPMRYGNLFLAGDAAHIVPPTGARGLNSAASDVYYLYHALIDHYLRGDDRGLENYSHRALARVWKGQRFSWWMTTLLHAFPDGNAYDARLRRTELDYLLSSKAAMTALAENYVGLPF